MPFNSPNYTQTPNELFDSLLKNMGYAELKIVLAVIRITFGYHREGEEVKATLSQMQRMTGLSRPAVLAGAQKAEDSGLIEKRFSETGELLWMVKLLYQDGKATLPEAVKQVYHPIPIKETEKKGKETVTAAAAPPRVSPEVLEVYQNNIGLPTPVILDDLEQAERTYSAAWVVEALKETARARVKRFAYTQKILANWQANGYKADRPEQKRTTSAAEPRGFQAVRDYLRNNGLSEEGVFRNGGSS